MPALVLRWPLLPELPNPVAVAEPLAETAFGVWNWLTLGLYLVAIVGIGIWSSRRIDGTEEFFLAGRRIPWWAAGLSIFGTQLSAITFMGIPATAYADDWVRVIGQLMIMAVLPLVIIWYVPIFRGLQLVTAYEYLERRFGAGTRMLAASLFVLLQFGRMGIVLFMPAIALSAATGVDVQLCIVLMGVLCIVYTVMGGIEAVIWTDVVQVTVLVAGAATALFIAISDVGGWTELWRIGSEHGKFDIVRQGWGLDTLTLPVMVVGFFFLSAVPYTTDQAVVQRYMTTRDQRASAHSLWANFAMTLPVKLIFFLLGTAMFVFYQSNPDLPVPEQNDQILPWFVVHQLPAGAAGLVIAAIFAASMSSLDSSMNSVSTVLVCDFYRRFRPATSDATQLRLGRWLTLILGAVGTATALVMASLEIGFLFDAFVMILGFFGGAMTGLFFLAVFCKRSTSAGAFTGTVTGALVVAGLSLLNTERVVIHPFLFAAIGFLVCVGVGWTISRIWGPPGAAGEPS